MQVRTAQPIATRDKPAADRRAVFVSIDNESATLDLLVAQQNDKFGQLRCIYIDTSAQDSSGNGCTIQTDIGQKIMALANTQGYYPVFVPFVTKLTISSNQAVTLLMLDFDMRPVTWATVLQSGSVPDPLHVIIDDQPIATNATVQNWPSVQPVSISGQPIGVAQASGWSVAQSGVWNVGATQNGTWNVGVTGTATVTWSTAKPVSVSNFPATQAVTQSGAWNIGINNWPTSQHVTVDAQPLQVTIVGTDPRAYINVGLAATVALTPASTFIKIVFDTVAENLGSLYNATTGQITIAASGYYQFSGGVYFQNVSLGDNSVISIFRNGSEYARLQQYYAGSSGGHFTSGACILYLSAGDVIEFRAFANDAGHLGTVVGGNVVTNYLQMIRY